MEVRSLLAADLVISEFMAVNESGLSDEDGDHSDWIEIFNRGNTTADLDGWHLTDDPDRLTKWEFPEATLGPGRSLVVFASDKDRNSADGELHTNFRLSVGGEFLGLVSPDGSTIVDRFDPYPPQTADVSYGREQTETTTHLVDSSTPSRLHMPQSADQDVPAAEWTAVGFNDTAWAEVPAAIGYDTNAGDGDFSPLITASGQVPQMNGSTAAAYLRSQFVLDGPLTDLDRFQLDLNFDDGYVAYLNGTEIARQNAPPTVAWNSTATAAHGGVLDVINYDSFAALDDQADINLVGAAGWQVNRIQLTPSVAHQAGAAWLKNTLSFGSDYSFSASMVINAHTPGGTSDIDGRGGDGMTFVLQDGGPNVLGGPGGQLGLASTGMNFVAVEFDTSAAGSYDPDATLGTHIGIDTSRDGNVARAAVPRFNGHVAFAGQPGPGVDLRYVWIDYNGATKSMDVFFSATDVRPASPTLSTTVDLAELFGGLSELTLGWTAGTGTGYNAQEVRRLAFTSGTGQLGLTPRTIDLFSHVDQLQVGANVLAIAGLNIAKADEDFLLVPVLSGQKQQFGADKFFLQSTPGEINGLGDEAPTGEVGFSVTTQTFVNPFALVLTPPNPNAVIRYTTDGELPTESSTLYSAPIQISASARIRARAFETGQGPGPVRSEGYIQLDSSLTNFQGTGAFSSNLPVMIFNSFAKNVEAQDTLMVPVTGIFISPDGDGRASILESGEFAGRGGMRVRGQSSQGFAKKQFALELWDEFNSDARSVDAGTVPDQSAAFFGLPAESDWVLNGPYSDKTQLNNYLTFLWSNNADLYAPRARLVEVFLDQTGGKLSYPNDYRGTYVLLEKIKRDDDRVDIAELTPDDNALPEISGGYIWKKDKAGVGDVPFSTSRGQELRMVEPDDRTITTTQKDWLRTHINAFESALYGPNFADPDNGYAKYIDVDSWAETWLLVEMTKNIDGFRLSTYYHKDRDGKIKQGPAWDYNLSLANGNYLSGAFPEGWYHSGLGEGDYPYWTRLFEDPNFEQRVIDRWHELRQTVWSTENLLADVDAAVAQLADGNPNLEKPTAGEPSNPISRNFSKWGTLNSYLWPNCYFGQGSCPTSPLPNRRAPSQYADYIFILKDFVTRRTAWMDTQLPRGPRLAPAGGAVLAGTQVTIDVPAGWQAVYTTDGSDPRLPNLVSNEKFLVGPGSNAAVLVPSNGNLIQACTGSVLVNPSQCFMNPSYVQGSRGEAWTSGGQGVGFDHAATYEPYIVTDVRAAMDTVNTSVYLRIPFQVTAADKLELNELQLRARYDDGFVAYLWSDTLNRPVEVARANAPGGSTSPITALAYNERASAAHADNLAVLFAPFDASASKGLLRTGTNYLIVQAMNSALTSVDFLIDVQLVGVSNRLNLPPNVFEYTAPIQIDRTTQLNARLLKASSQTWSGMTSELYTTSLPTIMISEINYHPTGPTAAELAAVPGISEDDFEFVELVNTGAAPVELVGVGFAQGIELAFSSGTLAPGAYGVVVKNEAAFRARYGAQPRVLGTFTGSLNNSGEALSLIDGAAREIVQVEYSDSSLWPQAADGVGATLQMIDPTATPATQSSKYYRWRDSTAAGGSPGSAGLAAIPVVVNEVVSHSDPAAGLSDTIEVFNPSDTAIDLSGWSVSDSAVQLLKYRFPAGTVLPPKSYLVIDESQFNPTPGNPLPQHFALNGSLGDDVWLTGVDAATGALRFVDDIHFGATAEGESLGRLPNGTGFLTPLTGRTFGAENTSPRIGPLMITEVMYAPLPPTPADLALEPSLTRGDLEFIEVGNPTGSGVDLTHWRLRAGVDFDFPANSQLTAGQSALILPFNPELPENANRLAAFRSHYGVPAGAVLLGGYTGQLSDGGEGVSLQQPDEPLPTDPNIIPRIAADEVVYDDLPPWPTSADGGGNSLQRVERQSYGNAAASWQAQLPTPGAFELSGTLPGDFNQDGQTNEADLNLFCAAFQQPNPSLEYDLTNDGVVDDADRDFMVRNVLGVDYGDANFDGLFDSSDLIVVFQAGQYEDAIENNSTWVTGDWDCDGDFNTSDLVLSFQTGSYVAAATPIAATPIVSSLTAATRTGVLSAERRPVDGDLPKKVADRSAVTAFSRELIAERSTTIGKVSAAARHRAGAAFANAADESPGTVSASAVELLFAGVELRRARPRTNDAALADRAIFDFEAFDSATRCGSLVVSATDDGLATADEPW